MKYTCHAIMDPHPYNGRTIGWCIRGNDKFLVGGYLNPLKDKIKETDPDAEFVEWFDIDSGEEEVLREGLEAWQEYKKQGYR